MNLVNFIASAIKQIQRGVVDRKSFFRHPVLATKDAQNIFQRVVVKREFDFEKKVLLSLLTQKVKKLDKF